MINLSNPNQSEGFLYSVPNVFSEDELSALDQYIKDKNTLDAGTLGGHGNEVRKSNIMWIEHNKLTSVVYSRLADMIKFVNDDHYHWNLTFLETLQYAEYPVGGHYKLHTDARLHGESYTNRKLSFSILINDDFEGGDLDIPGEYKIDLKPNCAILFPSSMPHCVTPIKEGVRKSLVGWVHGPNFV